MSICFPLPWQIPKKINLKRFSLDCSFGSIQVIGRVAQLLITSQCVLSPGELPVMMAVRHALSEENVNTRMLGSSIQLVVPWPCIFGLLEDGPLRWQQMTEKGKTEKECGMLYQDPLQRQPPRTLHSPNPLDLVSYKFWYLSAVRRLWTKP